MKLMFIGDIFGSAGREILTKKLSNIIEKTSIDIVIANAENAAAGFGLTPDTANEIFAAGVDVITMGNHVWDKKEILSILDDRRIVRPLNYPGSETPGRGFTIAITKKGVKVGIINLMGRTFMTPLDCPFKTAEKILPELKEKTDVVIVDFHAEATSEKKALGYFLDGKVAGVLGTHTHISTADETIFENGTAYITDVGMTGAHDSVLGVKKETIIQRFLTQMPLKYELATENICIESVLVEIDEKTGKAISIKRMRERNGN